MSPTKLANAPTNTAFNGVTASFFKMIIIIIIVMIIIIKMMMVIIVIPFVAKNADCATIVGTEKIATIT